jgi:hypothetical protein
VDGRRAALQQKFAMMAASSSPIRRRRNETAAGLVASIAWNVIYTAQEGIIAPVFRGSVWGLDQGSGYVLFEWDTFLAGWISTVVDPWVAKSNLIRMAKSMVIDPVHGNGGVVIGFWNGHCGEFDKSKPPIGSLLLEQIVLHSRDGAAVAASAWVAEIVVDQLAAWNKWWVDTRFRTETVTAAATEATATNSIGMYAPGSTREVMHHPLMCVFQNPVSASKCETGLDNSPLYDTAVFVPATDTLDQTDVGMTALVVADALALANVTRALGGQFDERYTEALTTRAVAIRASLQDLAWDESSSIYRNRNWQKATFVEPIVVAPTSFYTMIAGIPSDEMAQKMLARWLRNNSEFCVTRVCEFGIPSISRSSNASRDNNYWRGRAWGPMNFLVWLGLKRYAHLPEASDAMAELTRQSENTFLVEWIAHHRVMENYNSGSGLGCDVANANSFYHWGALTALIPFL